MDLHIGDYGTKVTNESAYGDALSTARGELEPVSFFETFSKMFSRELPESLPQDLLAETMLQWKDFWMFPAILAAGIFVVFALLFWDRTKTGTRRRFTRINGFGAYRYFVQPIGR